MPELTNTVTLSGISAHFTADEIETLVRTAAEAACGDPDELTSAQTRVAEKAWNLLLAWQTGE